MKFAQSLLEGTLLKRHFRFLAEIALESSRKKRMIYCPHRGALKPCDVLGSRLWFSRSAPGFSTCLDTWELTEVDGGVLVNMNPAYTKILVREAVLHGVIPELVGFHCLKHALHPGVGVGLELFWKTDGTQCFVHMEPVWATDHDNRSFGPEQPGFGITALEDLIHVKKLGHQAMLLYCVQHTGVKTMSLAPTIDPRYTGILEEALKLGVQVLAYGLSIGLEAMTLDTPIQLAFEDIPLY